MKYKFCGFLEVEKSYPCFKYWFFYRPKENPMSTPQNLKLDLPKSVQWADDPAFIYLQLDKNFDAVCNARCYYLF